MLITGAGTETVGEAAPYDDAPDAITTVHATWDAATANTWERELRDGHRPRG